MASHRTKWQAPWQFQLVLLCGIRFCLENNFSQFRFSFFASLLLCHFHSGITKILLPLTKHKLPLIWHECGQRCRDGYISGYFLSSSQTSALCVAPTRSSLDSTALFIRTFIYFFIFNSSSLHQSNYYYLHSAALATRSAPAKCCLHEFCW